MERTLYHLPINIGGAWSIEHSFETFDDLYNPAVVDYLNTTDQDYDDEDEMIVDPATGWYYLFIMRERRQCEIPLITHLIYESPMLTYEAKRDLRRLIYDPDYAQLFTLRDFLVVLDSDKSSNWHDLDVIGSRPVGDIRSDFAASYLTGGPFYLLCYYHMEEFRPLDWDKKRCFETAYYPIWL